jgi:hypothetical protein
LLRGLSAVAARGFYYRTSALIKKHNLIVL